MPGWGWKGDNNGRWGIESILRNRSLGVINTSCGNDVDAYCHVIALFVKNEIHANNDTPNKWIKLNIIHTQPNKYKKRENKHQKNV